MTTTLAGATVFDGDTFIQNGVVVIDGDRISSVESNDKARHGNKSQNLKGGYLVPGFIDIQVNGGGGALLNEHPTLATVMKIAESHRKFGTVGMLPTVITDAPDIISAAREAVSQAINESVPGVLGIHIEGPFLDKVRKGAHDPRFIRGMTARDIKELISTDIATTMLTVAPNRVSTKDIKALTSRGIRISLGHSDATCEEAHLALNAGATAFTHLFNAMSQLTGREAGMVGAAMSSDSFVGLIADGYHVHPASLIAAINAKGINRCMLITDAMATSAGGPATFELQGRKVTRNRGKLTLADGTLAGSNLTMDEAIRYCVNTLRIELGDTLRMASLTPATFLGLEKQLGRIRSGYLASLVHLDKDLKVKQTWINGK
jgi:N-acetylglucosamine-6-phosphate deacetylase